MDTAIRLAHWAYVSADRQFASITGLELPAQYFWMIAFSLPLLVTVFSRSVMVSAVICAISWVGASLMSDAPISIRSLALYGVCFGLTVCLAGTALAHRKHATVLNARSEQLRQELAETRRVLDRERFWRRTGGDARDQLPDVEVQVLWQRLEKEYGPRMKYASNKDDEGNGYLTGAITIPKFL